MSHALERLENGEYSFAFTGARENIWHSHGKQIPADLTPAQICEAASLNWKVEKHALPLVMPNGKIIETGHSALVRDRDQKVLDVVTNDWEPLQNEDAFEFFNQYVQAGDMSMDTAGSLHGGQTVWGLAKINNKFAVFGDDEVESYLLFTNPHAYASSISIRSVMTRVVCWNTISAALAEKSSRVFKQSHKTVFRKDDAASALEIVNRRMEDYKDAAEFLGSKQAKSEDVVEFFNRLFPVYKAPAKKTLLGADGNPVSPKDEPEVRARKDLSKTAQIAKAVLETQPGAQYAPGSWWQAFNASTFTVDHLKGTSEDRRFAEAVVGQGASLKNRALAMALEYAGAA